MDSQNKWDEFLDKENSALTHERLRYRKALLSAVRDGVHLRWETRRKHEVAGCDDECERRVLSALGEYEIADLFPEVRFYVAIKEE